MVILVLHGITADEAQLAISDRSVAMTVAVMMAAAVMAMATVMVAGAAMAMATVMGAMTTPLTVAVVAMVKAVNTTIN
jgi:hypothetical protein